MPIVGCASGFNYTERWGSKEGQKGGFTEGSRPVPEADWNCMSDAEKLATMGTTDGNFRDRMQNAWQKRSEPGGDVYNTEQRFAEVIAKSGARNWQEAERALRAAGFSDSPHEQGPLYKKYAQIWAGNAILTPSTKGTPYVDQYPRGMEGVYAAGPGLREAQKFQEWVSSGKSSIEGRDPATGYYYNRSSDGKTTYFDTFGYVVDPKTGARTGHYLGGSAADQAAKAGMGGGANSGPGVSAAGYAAFGGGGGGFGAGGGGYSPGSEILAGTMADVLVAQAQADLTGQLSSLRKTLYGESVGRAILQDFAQEAANVLGKQIDFPDYNVVGVPAIQVGGRQVPGLMSRVASGEAKTPQTGTPQTGLPGYYTPSAPEGGAGRRDDQGYDDQGPDRAIPALSGAEISGLASANKPTPKGPAQDDKAVPRPGTPAPPPGFSCPGGTAPYYDEASKSWKCTQGPRPQPGTGQNYPGPTQWPGQSYVPGTHPLDTPGGAIAYAPQLPETKLSPIDRQGFDWRQTKGFERYMPEIEAVAQEYSNLLDRGVTELPRQLQDRFRMSTLMKMGEQMGKVWQKRAGDARQYLQDFGASMWSNQPMFTGSAASKYGTDVGAETSRYATDVGAASQKYATDKGLSAAKWGALGNVFGQAGAALITSVSDARAKEDIEPLKKGLKDLRKIKTYKFRYKEGEGESRKEQAGLMAQNLQKVLPEAVEEVKLPSPPRSKRRRSSTLYVNPMPVLATLVNSVKELDEKMGAMSFQKGRKR